MYMCIMCSSRYAWDNRLINILALMHLTLNFCRRSIQLVLSQVWRRPVRLGTRSIVCAAINLKLLTKYSGTSLISLWIHEQLEAVCMPCMWSSTRKPTTLCWMLIWDMNQNSCPRQYLLMILTFRHRRIHFSLQVIESSTYEYTLVQCIYEWWYNNKNS